MSNVSQEELNELREDLKQEAYEAYQIDDDLHDLVKFIEAHEDIIAEAYEMLSKVSAKAERYGHSISVEELLKEI